MTSWKQFKEARDRIAKEGGGKVSLDVAVLIAYGEEAHEAMREFKAWHQNLQEHATASPLEEME